MADPEATETPAAEATEERVEATEPVVDALPVEDAPPVKEEEAKAENAADNSETQEPEIKKPKGESTGEDEASPPDNSEAVAAEATDAADATEATEAEAVPTDNGETAPVVPNTTENEAKENGEMPDDVEGETIPKSEEQNTLQDVKTDVEVVPLDTQEGEPSSDLHPPTTPAAEPSSESNQQTEAESLVPQEIPSATVKFVLLPTAQVATMKCALNQTLRELKQHFALELKIPADVILLLHDDKMDSYANKPEELLPDILVFDNVSDAEVAARAESEVDISLAVKDNPYSPSPTLTSPSLHSQQSLNASPQHTFIIPFRQSQNSIPLIDPTRNDGNILDQRANIENEKTLAELGVGPNGTVQLEMQSADPVNTPIKAFRPRQEYMMPDVITVRVETEPNRYKDIVVEVERFTRKKPYLGGYRHKQSNAEFHHASAQTGQKARGVSNVERNCRDTQTYQMKHIRQQTSEDTYTQMTKIGVYVSNMEDKLLVPGKYTTADQHHKMILQKVIILQKYWRRWLSTRYVTKLKLDRQKRLDWEKGAEVQKREEKELRIKKEFERRMNPKTKEDFDLLYAALEKWRLEEMDKIDSTLSGAERKAALCQLLDQETQLIGSIGRHKKDADSENKEKIVQSFLNKAASPKKWRGPDGCFTAMDTPYTIRAQELRDIYNSICMKYLTQDERLDVLLTLKHTVKEHDCKLTQEIIELIDREADLLMRGVRDANLEGLRKRISTLFLQYIKTPTFNPEAARLLKVPQDPSTLRQNIYYCASCNRYLPSVEYQLSTNSRTVGRCRKCRNLDNDARTRQDYSHYRLMLRELRRLEESYGDDSKVAFLLQENDLRYLVEKIWNSQSIVSAWDDLYDLILVRWDKHKEWSPWNCVLVTKEESTAHERLETLAEGYGKELLHKVHRKHTLARNYFSRLPGMSEHMRKRVTEPHDGPAVEGISVA